VQNDFCNTIGTLRHSNAPQQLDRFRGKAGIEPDLRVQAYTEYGQRDRITDAIAADIQRKLGAGVFRGSARKRPGSAAREWLQQLHGR
jgi:hypothetical protein